MRYNKNTYKKYGEESLLSTPSCLFTLTPLIVTPMTLWHIYKYLLIYLAKYKKLMHD